MQLQHEMSRRTDMIMLPQHEILRHSDVFMLQHQFMLHIIKVDDVTMY
jgi:hypothetical protein